MVLLASAKLRILSPSAKQMIRPSESGNRGRCIMGERATVTSDLCARSYIEIRDFISENPQRFLLCKCTYILCKSTILSMGFLGTYWSRNNCVWQSYQVRYLFFQQLRLSVEHHIWVGIIAPGWRSLNLN